VTIFTGISSAWKAFLLTGKLGGIFHLKRS